MWDQLALVDEEHAAALNDYADDEVAGWWRCGDCPPPRGACEGRPPAPPTPVWLMFVLAACTVGAAATWADRHHAPFGRCRRARLTATEARCLRCRHVNTTVAGWLQRLNAAPSCWRCWWYVAARRAPPSCLSLRRVDCCQTGDRGVCGG